MVKEEFFSTLDLFKKGIAKTNGDAQYITGHFEYIIHCILTERAFFIFLKIIKAGNTFLIIHDTGCY